MKKAIFAALTFIVVGFLLVNGTFALPDLDKVFADLTQWLDDLGLPEQGGEIVNVTLVSDKSPQQLYPGGSASRATCVRNEGTGDVYFRLVYAIQYDAESWPKLAISFDAGVGFDESDWMDITIGSTPYCMKVFTYTEPLVAGTNSPSVTLTIAMDESITSQELNRYRSDFLQTQVLAIDPTPFTEKNFTTAQDALDLALPLDTLNPF